MCRNHSHAVVKTTVVGGLFDGTVLTIAELANGDFTLEHRGAGGRLTVPQCSMLLLLSRTPATDYYSPEVLMAALWALSSVLAQSESDITTMTSDELRTLWEKSQLPTEDLP